MSTPPTEPLPPLTTCSTTTTPMMTKLNVVATFRQLTNDNPDLSAPVAAIQTLLAVIRCSRATTMSEFMETLNASSSLLKQHTDHPISVSAGCDLFMRFVTVTAQHDHASAFESCKEYLLRSGSVVVANASSQKQRIVELAQAFVGDGCCVLTHSYSRVVLQLLVAASREQHKRLTVLCTESRPTRSGYRMRDQLRKAGVPAEVILDSAVGYRMGQVDMVLVGAEGVVENGGLINQIGTYQIALVAKTCRKPFYAAAESFKFVRMYPLNQYDLPHYRPSTLSLHPNTTTGPDDHEQDEPEEQEGTMLPAVDYTPPDYITLLLTDLGALTPSGVSDELIKLYY